MQLHGSGKINGASIYPALSLSSPSIRTDSLFIQCACHSNNRWVRIGNEETDSLPEQSFLLSASHEWSTQLSLLSPTLHYFARNDEWSILFIPCAYFAALGRMIVLHKNSFGKDECMLVIIRPSASDRVTMRNGNTLPSSFLLVAHCSLQENECPSNLSLFPSLSQWVLFPSGIPTNVSISMYIEGISSFRAQTMDFHLDMYFQQVH